MPPPIRYPLPTLVLLTLLGLLLWRGAAWTRPLRSALADRWSRAVAGPPVPSSNRPQVLAGPITRKALLLHDDVAAAHTPGGPPAETIRLRMFVEIYDVWPLQGAPTHYRIGNRRPIGWVGAADLLPWDTRLAVRAPRGAMALAETADGPRPPSATPVGAQTLPVVAWTRDAVRVAVWDPDRPWQGVARLGWVARADLPPESWGVWISREELLALLRRAVDPAPPSDLRLASLRAVLGRLADSRALTDADRAAAAPALPPGVLDRAATSTAEASDRLARANEHWAPEASWAGLSFQFLPLTDLP
jgi:hypothetical protein